MPSDPGEVVAAPAGDQRHRVAPVSASAPPTWPTSPSPLITDDHLAARRPPARLDAAVLEARRSGPAGGRCRASREGRLGRGQQLADAAATGRGVDEQQVRRPRDHRRTVFGGRRDRSLGSDAVVRAPTALALSLLAVAGLCSRPVATTRRRPRRPPRRAGARRARRSRPPSRSVKLKPPSGERRGREDHRHGRDQLRRLRVRARHEEVAEDRDLVRPHGRRGRLRRHALSPGR